MASGRDDEGTPHLQALGKRNNASVYDEGTNSENDSDGNVNSGSSNVEDNNPSSNNDDNLPSSNIEGAMNLFLTPDNGIYTGDDSSINTSSQASKRPGGRLFMLPCEVSL